MARRRGLAAPPPSRTRRRSCSGRPCWLANSAAQVSTVLNAGTTCQHLRGTCARCARRSRCRSAICASEKPYCLSLAERRRRPARPGACRAGCVLHVARRRPCWPGTTGRCGVTRGSSSTVQPRRMASAMVEDAIGRRARHQVFRASIVDASLRRPLPSAPRPHAPVLQASAWPCCSDSSKVRPMAMTSPTAFMRGGQRRRRLPWNFSKAKRGTLTTQ